jgi:hypothetical protein
MSKDLTDQVGFAPPTARRRAVRRRFALAELIATIALAVCLVVALTVVSIGMARADALTAVAEPDSARLALAITLGVIMIAMGGITVLVTRAPG